MANANGKRWWNTRGSSFHKNDRTLKKDHLELLIAVKELIFQRLPITRKRFEGGFVNCKLARTIFADMYVSMLTIAPKPLNDKSSGLVIYFSYED